MGVNPLWEVQWHPAGGGRVRRLTLTRKGLRNLLAAAMLAALLVLAVMGVVPIGLRGLFQRFTVDSARRENEALRAQGELLREEAQSLWHRVHVVLGRGRRLAWALGRSPTLAAAASLPAITAAVSGGEIAAALAATMPQLDAIAETLAGNHAAPCPLAALPSAPPLDLSRAVPVVQFGWHTSAFTGREEAHHGTTLAAPAGEAVLAPGAGRVSFAGTVRERKVNEWSRFGTMVVIEHGGGVVTILGHLRDVAVRRGQPVVRGQRVGSVGQTGWTRVPALYFEVRWPPGDISRPIDPALVSIALAIDALDARLAKPHGDLPAGFALLAHLPRR